MRRVTVSLDDQLVELMEADVSAGRAASVSAWVASAIRAKAQARAELIRDLMAEEARDPTPPDVIASVAKSLGLPVSAVESAVRPRARRAKRTG